MWLHFTIHDISKTQASFIFYNCCALRTCVNWTVENKIISSEYIKRKEIKNQELHVTWTHVQTSLTKLWMSKVWIIWDFYNGINSMCLFQLKNNNCFELLMVLNKLIIDWSNLNCIWLYIGARFFSASSSLGEQRMLLHLFHKLRQLLLWNTKCDSSLMARWHYWIFQKRPLFPLEIMSSVTSGCNWGISDKQWAHIKSRHIMQEFTLLAET